MRHYYYKKITTLRLSGTQINVDLAINERRNVKPRLAEAWRGVSELKRGLGNLDNFILTQEIYSGLIPSVFT